jgi:protoporphyrinogen oxidase
LASSIEISGFPVERYYHFICGPDTDLLHLAGELGLHNQIHWVPTRTSYYFEGKLYPFSSPFDILGFQPVPFIQRLRFGLHVLVSRFRSDWHDLDPLSARDWLIQNIGQRAYEVIWDPLLRVKFGEAASEVSAAWIWNRIWRVAKSRKGMLEPEKMGYFEHGSTTLIQALLRDLQGRPGFQLRLGEEVRAIAHTDGRATGVELSGGTLAADAVLSTPALGILNRMLAGIDHPYFRSAGQVGYVGLVCALFQLDRAYSPAFWTNIHDHRISFNGIIEYTNLNRHYRDAGQHLIYVPFYLPTTAERFNWPDETIIEEYMHAFGMINPRFERSWVRDHWIFREQYAQAICTRGFANLVPAIRSPLKGLYVTDSTQFYPEDRTLSAAIRCGRQAAGLIAEDGGVSS